MSASLTRFLLCLTLATVTHSAFAAEPQSYDIVVYGGTASGVIAAIEADRSGKTAVVIEPTKHLGGLTTSGLGWTDTGNKEVIGGLSREFYRRLRRYYSNDSSWPHDDPQKHKQFKEPSDAMWVFEPSAAEKILELLLRETKVAVVRGERIDRKKGGGGVTKNGQRITKIRMESGKEFTGKMFIDATYEGDLMALAGVSYTIGREANKQYGETLNGVQVARADKHQFVKPVDPYVKAGDKSSGLLPGINTNPGVDGEADKRVQTYNYRVCMTDVPENRVAFERPAGYDPLDHELLLRNFEAGDLRVPLSIPGMLPNRKTDLNNNFAVSTDWIGMNYEYPEASYEEREKILKAHETYVRGFLWTLQTNPRVPEEVRKQVAKWGYAKDEFTDNGNFPYGIYVREARRMVSDYVQTENDCRRVRKTPESIGLGSYNMDSHNVQRHVDDKGHVRNEGDIQVSPGGPYLISYKSIVPKKGECENLFVPVCLSSSHIAYGSIRMEPVFMILGQSAAAAAVIAIDNNQAVQGVDYAQLRKRLLDEKQVLDLPEGSTAKINLDVANLPGVVVDNDKAKSVGDWSDGTSISPFVGKNYVHDGAVGKGCSMTYTLPIQTAGQYEVRLSYSANANRASNVTVVVHHAGGSETYKVDQKKKPEIDGVFHRLGIHRLEPGKATVEIRNDGANGHVIADAVQAVPAK
ncbi:MAG TPA: FAD-dependent oxidoreductase [Caulifigura sp.]|nr:FAD-dependent oxidoreductase [Caulifigura sp.]